MLGRALFYGAGAGKRPTASAIVADMIDILSNTSQSRKLPEWRRANEEEIATVEDYTCPHCFLIEGCPMCAAKAKQALGSEHVVMLDGRFVIVSAPTTKSTAVEALRAFGLEPTLVLPVLE